MSIGFILILLINNFKNNTTMLQQLKILKNVLDDLKVVNKICDKNGNLIQIAHNNNCFYFANSQTPFNNQDVVAISRDKEFSFNVTNSVAHTPITKGYLNPDCNERYQEYVEFSSINLIIEDIKERFKFPVILKPNKGARGVGVSICRNDQDLESALRNIFDQKSKDYDYVVLCQEFINIHKEFRVVCVNKRIELVYWKDNSEGIFNGNLSPLHWENSKAVFIQDIELIRSLQLFVDPIFEVLNIFWCGFDIAIDQNGQMWLIEINSNIGLNIFISQNDSQVVYNLYKTAITKFLKIN